MNVATRLHVFSWLIVLPLAFPPVSGAQATETDVETALDINDLEAHLRFLAADELMGRMTGRIGNHVAARYIAEQFRAAGLEQLPGAEGYYQHIPIGRARAPEGDQLVLPAGALERGSDFLLVEGNGADTTAELVYAGHGIAAPELGHNDYEGMDVDGRIVVVRYGYPSDRPDLSTRALMEEKRIAADTRGAIALIELYGGHHGGRSLPWAELSRLAAAQDTRVFYEHGLGAHLLVNDETGRHLAALLNGTDTEATISTDGMQREMIRAQNVVGLVPGVDPALKDQFVVLMAHYDHVGTVGQVETFDPDSIYNGARDNAMGVVALISAAKALSQSPPGRSLIFLAVTAEEIGMLGSGYYVRDPLIPLEQTVFVLNIDGAGFTDTSIVTVVGLERTTAEEAIVLGAEAAGLEAISDPVPEQNLFNRSDNVRFARAGVPAPTFSPGFRKFDAELMHYYHRTSDQVTSEFDFDYLMRFCRAFVESARNIADMADRPYWRPGDPYEAAGDALYGYQ